MIAIKRIIPRGIDTKMISCAPKPDLKCVSMCPCWWFVRTISRWLAGSELGWTGLRRYPMAILKPKLHFLKEMANSYDDLLMKTNSPRKSGRLAGHTPTFMPLRRLAPELPLKAIINLDSGETSLSCCHARLVRVQIPEVKVDSF